MGSGDDVVDDIASLKLKCSPRSDLARAVLPQAGVVTYYFDGIEVLRHATNDKPLQPHVVAVNYAIGGISGWPIDLKRYGNGSDMYVDYIRVYAGDDR